MRVSLFGLFLRCTSLMGPWPKRIQSILLVINFILDFLFYGYYVLLVHTGYTCVLNPVFWTWYPLLYSHCVHPGSPPGFCITLAWGVSSDSPGFSCPGFGAWSVWILPVADQSGAAVAWISCRLSGALSFLAPVCLSSFRVVNSWVPLYCLLLYIPCTLAIAPIRWCNIIVISDHLWW